ncbi:hypothetical protein PILCRDRAFT_6470 [Piloderma croceum F 1598]|uniref:Uncharacterized protein n=1 Tax=Piloderma croceum (strain F 1598) TaxID=765440 RepID=A0A0C3FXC1_PILCF|nr:hypothetical protein PILCRDRAFT_6470 [Piloderma croceum F 1598]
MSCATSSLVQSLPSGPRKRTSSFSTPKPYKAARMGSLRRTASYIVFPDFEGPPQFDTQPSSSSADCTALVLRHYKEQRQRRGKVRQAPPQFTIGPVPSFPPPPVPTPSPMPMHFPRASSPLAPKQKLLPPRASFPRSKQEPNLYKIAITTRMRCSPEGQKILSMGPRLAVSILTATRDLERIVASHVDVDKDISMMDGTLSKSWVVIPGDDRDWEMIDCSS